MIASEFRNKQQNKLLKLEKKKMLETCDRLQREVNAPHENNTKRYKNALFLLT